MLQVVIRYYTYTKLKCYYYTNNTNTVYYTTILQQNRQNTQKTFSRHKQKQRNQEKLRKTEGSEKVQPSCVCNHYNYNSNTLQPIAMQLITTPDANSPHQTTRLNFPTY